MKRKLLIFAAAIVVLAGSCTAIFKRGRWGENPCNEPADLPVPRARVVECAERYVFDQWYTDRFGKIGALDSDSHGGGGWFELATKRRNTVRREVAALCTHPRDEKGALGHVALFEAPSSDQPCRVFSVTPLLSVTAQGQTCDTVRATHKCIPRADAVQ